MNALVRRIYYRLRPLMPRRFQLALRGWVARRQRKRHAGRWPVDARCAKTPEHWPGWPEPHRFAQGFGGVVLVMAVIALITGVSLLGWLLVWVVIGLAGLNLFLGFCAGCFLYYQMNRLNVPGFEHSRIR